MPTGNLLLQSWCYPSVSTNAITALFAESRKKKHGKKPSRESSFSGKWSGAVHPGKPPVSAGQDTVARLGWRLTTSPRDLCLITALFQRGRARVGCGMEKVPHGRCPISPRCGETLRRRCGQTAGRSSPSSFRTRLYLEANCKQSDGELLLLLPINYPAAWDANGLTNTSRRSCASGGRRGTRREEMLPSQYLQGSPHTAPGPHLTPTASPQPAGTPVPQMVAMGYTGTVDIPFRNSSAN